MNPNDKEMIESLSMKIKQAHPVSKDQQANALITQEIASQPDAMYLMTQTVLLQEAAIKQLQQQVNDLQQNANQQGGMFSSIFGQRQAPPPRNYQQNIFGQGSFLQSALSTAVGVAGGMMLFNGISHLFSSSHDMANSDSMLSSSPLVENLTDQQFLTDGFGAGEDSTDLDDGGDDFFDGGDDWF